MRRTGVAELPLHWGKAPYWLILRMRKLARALVTILINEFGSKEFLRRVSDPHWFQALGCTLGFDWHSSGLTTTLTGVLKQAISPQEHGVAICGGKGRFSRKTPDEIKDRGEKFGISTKRINSLTYASRLSAKVDNVAIQAGYPLYHHAFFFDEKGRWAVVQQGMCPQDRTARRYHWIGEKVKSFVIEPHQAIVGDVKREKVLDMTAMKSKKCRKASVDLAKEKPERVARLLKSIRPSYQRSLKEWISKIEQRDLVMEYLYLPKRVNWNALKKAYDFQPKNYEELLAIRGIGPATARGLALISELVYGEPPSWRDPIKYSFAYGGKDGVPFPVDRKAMDESVSVLRSAIKEAKLGRKEKLKAIQRLKEFLR
jgi:hypothetical protein